MTLRTLISMFAAVFMHALLSAQPASALSCSASAGIAFGTINLTTGLQISLTGSMTVDCLGVPGQVIRACANLGTGSGLAAANGSRRYMHGLLGGTIDYNLYSDSGLTSIWGSVTGTMSSYPPPPIDVTIGAGGTGTRSVPIYGRIFSSQQAAGPDVYSSSFIGIGNFSVASASATGNPTCAAIGTTNQTGGSATVAANYVATCSLSVDPMSFGTLASTLAPVNSSTTVHAACSATIPFTIALNYGLTAATDPTAREMQSGANRLRYGLYLDNGRVQPWGYTAGVNVYAGTGLGVTLNIPVYGRIPAQPTPPSGTYTDTVIVTIDY